MTDGRYVGDIRLCNPDRDAGKPLNEISDFEIWTGSEWVHARDAAEKIYGAEIVSS